jgi:hypothetical protein
VRGLVARYYLVLRSVLKEKPHLKTCLTRCRHCNILFFTHPRNAGRNDLGCPFGCREAHRRKKSIERSTEYYRYEENKEKKKALNRNRSKKTDLPETKQEETIEERCEVDRGIVSHVRLVTSLIEGRNVSLNEIYRMLNSRMRQHSIDSAEKTFYGGPGSQKIPP